MLAAIVGVPADPKLSRGTQMDTRTRMIESLRANLVHSEPASEPATPPEDYDWEVEATAAWFEDLSLFSDPHESDIPSELVEFREAYRHWKLTEWAVEISSHGSAASGIQQARPPTESLSGDELSTPSPAESEGELEPANQPPFLN